MERALIIKLFVERGWGGTTSGGLPSPRMVQNVWTVLRDMGFHYVTAESLALGDWRRVDLLTAIKALRIHSPLWWAGCGYKDEDIWTITPYGRSSFSQAIVSTD